MEEAEKNNNNDDLIGKFITDDSGMKKFEKKNYTFMENFIKNKDLVQDNSHLKFNQINSIDKYGLIYFYDEYGIYFLDNTKIQQLFKKNINLVNYYLFFLKCKNIFKIFTIEENQKVFLIICTKKDENYPHSFLIYIDMENFIEKAKNQKAIYDIKIMEELEEEEELFTNGIIERELNELKKNGELKEDEEYVEEPEVKEETFEEKKEKFYMKKEDECKRMNDIFENKYTAPFKYEPFKVIYLGDDFKDVILLDINQYIILKENMDIFFYNNYEVKRIIQKNASIMNYNKETSIFLIISNDSIYIFKETDNFNTLTQIKSLSLHDIVKEENDLIIFGEVIYNYIVLYTIENSDQPQNDDKLFFIEMNENMNEIKKIYIEDKYFYPDDYELEGIACDSQKKRTVFSVFDKDYGVYFIFNKHMDKLEHYYAFKQSDENEQMYNISKLILNDDNILNSRIENLDEFDNDDIKKLESNPFIGISFIKFKFDGYTDEKVTIFGEEVISPYLIIVLGFYGGFTIYYAGNSVQEDEYKLMEKGEYFKDTNNICNKVLEISIDEEKTFIEKEKYEFETKKKEKNFTELFNLRLLQKRNIFLHELDHTIKENLDSFKELAIPQKIKSDLSQLEKISKNKDIIDFEKSIDTLIEEGKKLFEEENQNQKFIDDKKELIKNYKNTEEIIKNNIKSIEENRNEIEEQNININTPINEVLTHPKMKNFLTEKRVEDMINIFNKIKKYYNLYDNHINLISKLFTLNEDLIKQIEECKTRYNSIKNKYLCLQNRKDAIDAKANLQNNIFLLYMRVFEQFFVNLEIFETDNLNKEYLYLNQLKLNSEKQKQILKEDEDEDEKENKKGIRFQLRDEEDIDEDNKSLDSNELNDQIITTSKKHRNKFIEINNNNNIDNDNDNENSINIIDNDNNDNSNSVNYSHNPNQDLILGNNNNLILKKANDTINKIFGTNLVEERGAPRRNYLIDVLSEFEGRVTLYNEETDKDFCEDADEFFGEFLQDEKEIEKKKKIEINKKENKEKEKKKIIKNLKNSLLIQNDEKKKIEDELNLIGEKDRKEIIEREKENEELKKKFEELQKKYEEFNKLRKAEKKKYDEQINNNIKKNAEQKKIKDEQSNTQIKSLEEEIKKLNIKLKEVEDKRNEAENKVKTLEEEKKNINIKKSEDNIINNNVNQDNLSNNARNEENAKKNEENSSNQNNQNQTSLFVSNIQKDKDNIFLHNPEEKNIPQKQNSIFDNITSLQNSTDNLLKSISNATDQSNNQTNNDTQNKAPDNLFTSTSTNNNNIFSSKQNTTMGNIFKIQQTNTQSTQQPAQNNQGGISLFQRNQNQKTQINSIFGNINSNESSNTGLFKNFNFSSITQNNTNALEQGQGIFGEHKSFGNIGNTQVNTTNQRQVLHFGTSNTTNTVSNNVSPFGGFNSGFGTGLFNNQINQNNQNKPNNDNEFF